MALQLINPGEELLNIDTKVYRIPKQVDLTVNHGRDKEVAKRTRELAKQYGTNFHSFFDGIRCTECNHLDWKAIASSGGGIIEEGPASGFCRYEGNTDRMVIFTKRKFFFLKESIIAKTRQCTVRDAFYRALMEQGHLDKFLIKDTIWQEFYPIGEIERNSVLERKAVDQYKKIKK
ncbi:hypothetical protein KY308_04450 [Candidatus Woesearchaeota archaeon]|nr:hypothetical protein [Candidatus Woesearchaeota archaeon]